MFYGALDSKIDNFVIVFSLGTGNEFPSVIDFLQKVLKRYKSEISRSTNFSHWSFSQKSFKAFCDKYILNFEDRKKTEKRPIILFSKIIAFKMEYQHVSQNIEMKQILLKTFIVILFICI